MFVRVLLAASIQDIPCDSSMSFCISQSTAGSGQFVLPLSGSESYYGSTKTWQVTDINGNLLIPETSESATALDGNLNLEIDQVFACCTASNTVDCTHLHVSMSTPKPAGATYHFTSSYDTTTGEFPSAQVSCIQLKQDGAGFVNPVYPPGHAFAGTPQVWMCITLTGSKAPQSSHTVKYINQVYGFHSDFLVVPTGSTVAQSAKNIVEHVNNSSSHADFSGWLSNISASSDGSDITFHRKTIGASIAQAYYVNYSYNSSLTNYPWAVPNGVLFTTPFVFSGGATEGSTAVTLSFTRSGCTSSNLLQELNVCYEESIFIGSGFGGEPLEASSSCCFFLQLNDAPFWNGSSSYCQKDFGSYIDLDAAFGVCNYNTITFGTDAITDSYFVQNDSERPGNWFYVDGVTKGLGHVILNFTASTSNSICINSASGQPSMSAPFYPTAAVNPTPNCCPDISGSQRIYFHPGVSAGPDTVQCWPSMSLNGSTIYNFPLSGNPTWSLSGGLMNNGSVPNLTNLYLGNSTVGNYSSHSLQTEAYFLNTLATKPFCGMYTMSLTVWNGPCSWSDDVNIIMVSTSANAGPDQTVCQNDGGVRFTTAAQGLTGIWSVLTPQSPPAPAPIIHDLFSPTTKIDQVECSTYVYGWTVSSQSSHILNEKTYSVICEDTDYTTFTVRKNSFSASIDGILDDPTAIFTSSVYTAASISAAPYEINVYGCPPYTFSFVGTVDNTATEATWSVYMSSSFDFHNIPSIIPPPPDHSGIMGKFEGTNFTIPLHITGTVKPSESNAGTLVNEGLATGLFPFPEFHSPVFHYSSSHLESYGGITPTLIELSSFDKDCGCRRMKTFGRLFFHPTIEDNTGFSFVIPTATGAPGTGWTTANETNWTQSTANFATEPTMGVVVPKYIDVTMMSFHSGSNNYSATSQSSIISKANNMNAPYLTMSWACQNINHTAIDPITKKQDTDGIGRSSVCSPTINGAFWPGPAAKPTRFSGITSGSGEKMAFEWKAWEISIYNSAGVTLEYGVSSVPARWAVTGSFVDTMTSISYEEAPSFFPAHRFPRTINGLPAGATAEAANASYLAVDESHLIYSQSTMFEVTMSRLNPAGTVVQTLYASQSIMFIKDNSP